MRFKDSRGVEYVYDQKLHCGNQRISATSQGNGSVRQDTFCIVGPGHYGSHWDGDHNWPQAE